VATRLLGWITVLWRPRSGGANVEYFPVLRARPLGQTSTLVSDLFTEEEIAELLSSDSPVPETDIDGSFWTGVALRVARRGQTTVGDLFSESELDQLIGSVGGTGTAGRALVHLSEPALLPEKAYEPPLKAEQTKSTKELFRRCLMISGTVLILAGSLALSPNRDTRETGLVMITAVGALFGLRSATSRRRPTPTLQAAPFIGAAPAGNGETDDALYLEAVSLCQRMDYKAAEQRWRVLASNGHTASIYALALLYSVVDSTHAAALEEFQLLRLTGRSTGTTDTTNDRYEARAALGIALLAIEADFSADRVAQLLESASLHDTRGCYAERRAQELALGLLAELRSTDSGSNEHTDTPVPDELRSEFHYAIALARRSPDGPRGPLGRRRQLASTISRVVALTLPLSVAGHKTLRILPVDLVPKRRPVNREPWFRRSVPVLHSDHPESDPYASRWVTGASRWLIRHGIRGLTPGLGSLAATVGAAILIARGQLRWAAVLLAGGALIDAVDGRVVQLSSTHIRIGLFLDYIFDRLGDIALGFGYLILFHSTNQMFAHVLIANAFLTVCLLSSYVRAEGARFDLNGAGGLFERPHRMLMLIVGLLILRPVYSLYGVTILSSITLLERGIQSLSSFRQDSVAELGLRAATVPGRPGTENQRGSRASSVG
jgi:CDP-diacylglycerol--glycerol-3-phosphate 3-phosphatidyltransferase